MITLIIVPKLVKLIKEELREAVIDGQEDKKENKILDSEDELEQQQRSVSFSYLEELYSSHHLSINNVMTILSESGMFSLSNEISSIPLH
eukprot:CAMPEP_0170524684 /NCGR_PEP_ID=MMETSP0209-20121228/10169_1 /TAXON_ID=665100 ORGANISM="Litonotus pictus, Strain P1" /NCGR_SAMPLE_ID=MMETSP0209 /ASSEMBLY_ACC=CAM_ASM_000301 /LENGTH=89 /DNA_ID=CAMNT_0010813531 /DNA_START=340 /DNA_END=606 /DNA_ORIENTATION=-